MFDQAGTAQSTSLRNMERKRLLFITNAELGQANVHLAVLEQLIIDKVDADLHLCSFGSLAQSAASSEAFSSGKVSFHALQGPTWKDALFNRPEHQWHEVCSLAPRWFNSSRAAPMMTRIVAPWSNEELADLVLQVDKVVSRVAARLVVVDNLFTPAVTVCYDLGVNWVVLSPNTYREFILGHQPPHEQHIHPPFVISSIISAHY
jgi:hypothetical protein